MIRREYQTFGFCCGLGGGAKGFKKATANELTLRCVWLMCEAWKDAPAELIVFENVPQLATRGRHLLDQIKQLLAHYGYAVNETTHDCGVIGGLAQSRKRFLMVARHTAKVPAFLYEPPVKRLQGVGTVLGRMPLPGDAAGGPMHRVPSLQWKTWVRLAFVEAGSDWRKLNKLAVENGHLRDYLIVPEYRDLCNGLSSDQTGHGHKCGNESYTESPFRNAQRLSRSLGLVLRRTRCLLRRQKRSLLAQLRALAVDPIEIRTSIL